MDNIIFTMTDNNTMKSLLGELESSTLGNYLDQYELDVLLKHSRVINFSPGDMILKQGKITEEIFILIEGHVNVIARILGQGVTDIETFGPGCFLGEICFIEEGPCPTSVVANTEVRCLVIGKTYFDLLSAYFPEIKHKILVAISHQVCGRLKRVHDKVADYMTDSDMASLSFFGKVAQTFNQPRQLTFEESGISKELLAKQLSQLFDKEEIAELFKQMELLEVSKNCKLIDEDEKKASCYIVVQGAVQSSIVHDNKLAKLSVIGPKTLFSGVACVDINSSYAITFISCEQAILLRLSGETLTCFQQNMPALWYKLFNLICNSLVALEKSIDKLDIRLHIEAYNR
ncbi:MULTISPECIES: Crp/Fnr family transcriptional regulator [unclassified Legionella]|uniref:Crp/Fnr family transcriptional regulator n=1 Tax=unclassified Legionella TaxID=2622702 RepID=UPI001055E9D3|nr:MULTISPECIES: cyclic nucleotide-binding domain-containing protein [unclassified Legionella]MDI9817609.1 cyclic nucleotide-binding domain-containing protein [Legionella sp. PL877]